MVTLDDLTLPERMQGTQHRAAEIEHLDPDAGTILVRVAPYGREVRLDRDLWEAFEPRAFEAASKAPHRVKMRLDHGGPLIGHATTVEDRSDGSWAFGKFSNTTAAQEARELCRDGTLDQVSVEFVPQAWRKPEKRTDGIHVRHTRSYMLGFALVPHGAYAEGAYVASVRDADAGGEEARARELLERQREERLERLRALHA